MQDFRHVCHHHHQGHSASCTACKWENNFSKIALPGLGHTVSKHELQGIPKQVRSLMGEKVSQKDMHLVTEWENISMQ